jgi:hypothetical protein
LFILPTLTYPKNHNSWAGIIILMKRILLVLALFLAVFLLWGLLTSSASVFPFISQSPPPVEQTPGGSVSPRLTPGVLPAPSETPSDTATASPSPTPFLYPTLSQGYPFEVRYHPDGGLYVGDLVSLEVIAPLDFNTEGAEVLVEIGIVEVVTLGPQAFGRHGIAGRTQATFMWAWDTSGLIPGEYTLTFTIIPQEVTWDETITLYPESQLPLPEPDASWGFTQSECCIFHYISNTAAERHLQQLMDIADEQAILAAERIGIDFNEPITITLMPRVLGHGGFAGREIYISYLDRNYAGDSYPMVVHHEMVHILDGRLGGGYRPSLFVEGVAVYLTGGHFKPEPLMPRATTLLENGIYIPLLELADNFYPSQHEIGYLQAGALVEFMVATWGWDGFSDFYRSIPDLENGFPSLAIDLALQENFGITYSDLEDMFLADLRRLPSLPEMEADVRLTIAYYDTVRRYQQDLDPSAYFMTAWLPNIEEMRQRGIQADLIRPPSTPENIALEAIFVQADKHLRAGDFAQVDIHLQAINTVLDAMQLFDPYPFDQHSLAADHYAITLLLLNKGYQLISAEIESEKARVQAGIPGSHPVSLNLIRDGSQWRVLPESHEVRLRMNDLPVRLPLSLPFFLLSLLLTSRKERQHFAPNVQLVDHNQCQDNQNT